MVHNELEDILIKLETINRELTNVEFYTFMKFLQLIFGGFSQIRNYFKVPAIFEKNFEVPKRKQFGGYFD